MNTTTVIKIQGYNIKKATITENITPLDHFLDLIDKSCKHTKSTLLAIIYMTPYGPLLDYRRFSKLLRD